MSASAETVPSTRRSFWERFRFGGNLWRHRDFLKFWTGDTLTQFTGQITDLALPTIAILTLQVTAFELGILTALAFIAFPTMGLLVGVWIDRVRRRPIMILMNLIQVVTLSAIPLAYYFGLLSLYQLYLVAFLMGTTTLFFDVAYQSYLPSLVERKDVIEGNQKLQTSASAAQVVGPSVASGLMELLGPAMSVVADVIGTFVSSIALLSIRKPEPEPEGCPTGQRHFFAELKEGVRVVTGNSLLWTQAGCTGMSNLGSNIFFVAFFLYAFRRLGITAGLIGVVFTIGAIGFLVGTLVASRVTRRLGFGPTIAVSIAFGFALLLVLLAGGPGPLAVFIIGLALFVSFIGTPIYNINQVSLRQIITPNRLQGRMNATMRTLVWGTIPLGSFLGGIFSETLGLVPTLIVGALVSGGSAIWIVLGPIYKLRTQPDPVNE